MNLRSFFLGVLIITFSLMHNVAHAARSFSYAQSPLTASAIFNMGSVQTLSYQIANTSTGGNAGERIYEMRFNLPGTGTVFSSSTTAPLGWTRTAFSTLSVTFQATSWANAIAVGGTTTTFPLVFIMVSASADLNDSLKSLRAGFTTTTTGPPFPRTGRTTINTTNLWTLKSLAITSFQITDTLGNPITALAAGSSFRLVMTIKNNTTASVSNIVSNPAPPTAFSAGVTQALTSTVGSPLTLAAGASGTITFTYSTSATDSGTIYFTATAKSGANITSALATSNTLAVGRFIASLNPAAPICLYAGANLTVTMDLTNKYPYNITNVTTNLAPVAGAPVNYISGPAPASPIATIATTPPAAVTSVTWVYQVNNNLIATDPFTFSGGATGTGNTAGFPIHTTPSTATAPISRGEFPIVVNPAITNAASGNVQLTWTVTNNGCANVNSVAIAIPAGWTWANDAYSLVTLGAGNSIETWVASGTNPITFTYPGAGFQLPQAFSGDFSLVFSATPAAATTSTFTVTVTDASAAVVTVPVTVTVNPFLSGVLNSSTSNISREEFR